MREDNRAGYESRLSSDSRYSKEDIEGIRDKFKKEIDSIDIKMISQMINVLKMPPLGNQNTKANAVGTEFLKKVDLIIETSKTKEKDHNKTRKKKMAVNSKDFVYQYLTQPLDKFNVEKYKSRPKTINEVIPDETLTRNEVEQSLRNISDVTLQPSMAFNRFNE